MKNFKINQRIMALIASGIVLSGSLISCGNNKKNSEQEIITTYITENNDEEYNFYDVLEKSKKDVEDLFSYAKLLDDKTLVEIEKLTFDDNNYVYKNTKILSPQDFENLIKEYLELKKENKIVINSNGTISFNPVVYEIRNQTILIDKYINNNMNKEVMDYIFLLAKKYACEMIGHTDPLSIEISYTIEQSKVSSVVMVPETGKMYYIESSLEQDINNYNNLIGYYDNIGYMEKNDEIDIEFVKDEYEEANKVFVEFITKEQNNKIKTITNK